MKILAIETSCDETAIAVLKAEKNDLKLLANIVSSQINTHKKFGGVVPEIASRYHVKNINYVLDKALKKSKTKLTELDAICVTSGPGLVGALLVGVSFAKALAYSLNIPLVGVHHIAGHISANYLTHKDLKPPFISLVVSGGHSHIIEVIDYTTFKVLARTRDDAVGEAFDKVARQIGLEYPGGPNLSKLAKKGKATYKLPKTHFENSCDFSFSGIKTSVLNLINKEGENLNKANLCKSFEENVTDVLLEHSKEILDKTKQKNFALAGGVSANTTLRKKALEMGKENGINIYLPDQKYTTDNAAMIAVAGYYNYIYKKNISDLTLNAKASMDIEKN